MVHRVHSETKQCSRFCFLHNFVKRGLLLMILSLLCICTQMNLPHYLNYVAALPCKMQSAHLAFEIVDFLCQETPDFNPPDL